MKSPTHIRDIEAHTDKPFPETFKTILGKTQWRRLSDHFGLSHFAVNMERIYPGGQSALRHWHTKSDEFVLILEGELTLVTEHEETLMSEGMCAAFKAGEPNGHHLVNRSDEVAEYLVVGSRVAGDEVQYPDHDLQWLEENGKFVAAKKDGTPYE